MRVRKVEGLRPCPFCGGGEAVMERNEHFDYWWLTCKRCGAQVSAHGKEETIEKWERRAPVD